MDGLVQIRAPWMKPHEYILIQEEMLLDDDAWINDQLLATDVGKQLASKQINLKIQVGAVKLATLRRMIKGWNITKTVKQPDGNTTEIPLLYAPENVGRLPKPYSDFIYKEINDRNPDMSEQEAQSFLPPASHVIEANP